MDVLPSEFASGRSHPAERRSTGAGEGLFDTLLRAARVRQEDPPRAEPHDRDEAAPAERPDPAMQETAPEREAPEPESAASEPPPDHDREREQGSAAEQPPTQDHATQGQASSATEPAARPDGQSAAAARSAGDAAQTLATAPSSAAKPAPARAEPARAPDGEPAASLGGKVRVQVDSARPVLISRPQTTLGDAATLPAQDLAGGGSRAAAPGDKTPVTTMPAVQPVKAETAVLPAAPAPSAAQAGRARPDGPDGGEAKSPAAAARHGHPGGTLDATQDKAAQLSNGVAAGRRTPSAAPTKPSAPSASPATPVADPTAAGTGLAMPAVAPQADAAMQPRAAAPQTTAPRAGAVEQVAVKLQRAAGTGQNRVSIRLHPAELGRIEAKLEITEDGTLRALLLAERGETLELLQRDSRSLQRALEQAGLALDRDSLSFGLRGEGRDGEAPRDAAPAPGDDSETAADDGDTLAPGGLRHAAHDGVLDLTI